MSLISSISLSVRSYLEAIFARESPFFTSTVVGDISSSIGG